MKVATVILAIWASISLSAQSLDIHFGGNYGIPQYDAFFDQGFEGRLGLQARVRSVKSERLRVGFVVGYQNFRQLRDNFTLVDEARAYWLGGALSYDLASKSRNLFEPVLEVTYSFINYNAGDYFGSGLGLSPGLQYLYFVQDEYGIELALLFKNVFDRFGGELNPADASLHQILEIRLGFTIPMKIGA